ncbi:hypothetical protein GCM10023237_37420 [Streptomyces coeruleoprunus]
MRRQPMAVPSKDSNDTEDPEDFGDSIMLGMTRPSHGPPRPFHRISPAGAAGPGGAAVPPDRTLIRLDT